MEGLRFTWLQFFELNTTTTHDAKLTSFTKQRSLNSGTSSTTLPEYFKPQDQARSRIPIIPSQNVALLPLPSHSRKLETESTAWLPDTQQKQSDILHKSNTKATKRKSETRSIINVETLPGPKKRETKNFQILMGRYNIIQTIGCNHNPSFVTPKRETHISSNLSHLSNYASFISLPEHFWRATFSIYRKANTT